MRSWSTGCRWRPGRTRSCSNGLMSKSVTLIGMLKTALAGPRQHELGKDVTIGCCWKAVTLAQPEVWNLAGAWNCSRKRQKRNRKAPSAFDDQISQTASICDSIVRAAVGAALGLFG
jgi:hypothetical protein